MHVRGSLRLFCSNTLSSTVAAVMFKAGELDEYLVWISEPVNFPLGRINDVFLWHDPA